MKTTSSLTFRVRYQETDQMGVVHHGNYINWFEIGRTDWLRKSGTTYRDVEDKGLLLPVIRVICDYKKPAYYDDLVQVRAALTEYTGVKLTFAYDIYRDEERLVTGQTFHCWTNRELKPIHLKKVWPALHEMLLEHVDKNR